MNEQASAKRNILLQILQKRKCWVVVFIFVVVAVFVVEVSWWMGVLECVRLFSSAEATKPNQHQQSVYINLANYKITR